MASTRSLTSRRGAPIGRARKALRLAPLVVIAVAVVVVFPLASSDAAPVAVTLGTAQTFAVLAGAGVSNTGATTLNGDLGTYPTTSITGIGTITQTGTNHAGDSVTQGAKTDLVTAYNAAAGEGPTSPIVADLGGQTLTAGVYNSASSIGLTGTLTLDGAGNANSVFVFQAGSTLTTASASQISLTNGAQSCNVFWQVGSSATLGTGSSFRGTILALSSITVTTGTAVDGRVLARNGAVTLDTDTITAPTCTGSASNVIPSSTVGSTTTTTTAHATEIGVPETPGAPPTHLPFTGFNPLLPLVGGLSLLAGICLLSLSGARRRRQSSL